MRVPGAGVCVDVPSLKASPEMEWVRRVCGMLEGASA